MPFIRPRDDVGIVPYKITYKIAMASPKLKKR